LIENAVTYSLGVLKVVGINISVTKYDIICLEYSIKWTATLSRKYLWI